MRQLVKLSYGLKFNHIKLLNGSGNGNGNNFQVHRLVGTEGGQKSQEIRETTAKPKSQTLPEIASAGKDDVPARESTISKAMHSYLERAKEHQRFMKEQEEDFKFGRRHLANIMGKNPETFTQQDINEAIRYLFPAGLFEPKARPMMKPPEEIYPKQKAAQFDLYGRPHHPFFFTAKPHFYSLIHELVGKLQALNDPSLATQSKPIDSSNEFGGSAWITKDELEKRILEFISDELYNEFINLLERLVSHPRGGRELEFIKSFRKDLASQSRRKALPQVTLEPDGKQSVTVELCQKKTAMATVTVRMPGSGEFNINGKGLDYFGSIQAREMVLFPLQLVDWLGTVDITSTVSSSVEKRGYVKFKPPAFFEKTCEAYAIRWGIAMGLAALGADSEKLRLAGLLTPDKRHKERSHIAHTGARRAWTWKKR